jgi:hypothetical protein
MELNRQSVELELNALHAELESAQRRLEVACHIKAEDKVSFDFAVLDELAALREAARWIPVGERLPKKYWYVTSKDYEVAVSFPDGRREIRFAMFHPKKQWTEANGDYWENITRWVTHWREQREDLPPAPAEGGEGSAIKPSDILSSPEPPDWGEG